MTVIVTGVWEWVSGWLPECWKIGLKSHYCQHL